MASKLKVAQITSHVGGLNVYANATQVGDSESPDLLNVEFFGISAVRKRRGFQRLVSSEVATGKKIDGIFSYVSASGREVLYASNGNLYKYNGAAGSTSVTAGVFTAGSPVNACQVGSRLYFVTGSDALKYYDGSAVITTGVTAAPTTPTQAIYFNSRIYCTSSANKDRVYYGSPLGSDGTATNTGDFTVDTDSGYFGFGLGQEVVGFAKIGTSLYVFLRNAIYRLDPVVTSGTLSHSSSLISNAVGCQASRTIENVENDVYFLDSTVYSLGEVATFNSLRTRNVSAKIQSIFAGMSQASIQNASSIYYEKEQAYMIAISVGGSTNDRVLNYSVPYKAWTLWDGYKVNSWTTYIDSNQIKHLYFGSDSSSASYVYEAFQALSDDGVAVNAYYRTKQFDLGQFNIEKIFQNWNIQLGGVYGTLTVKFLVDGVVLDTISFSSGANVGTSDGIGSVPIGWKPIGREGNYVDVSSTAATVSNDWRWHTLGGRVSGTNFQLEYSNANLNESFEVKQAAVGYLPLPYYKRSAARQV
jgi:hypothetical protein